MEPPEGTDERRLSPGDRRFLAFAIVVGAACLALGLWLYPQVNPEASIRFVVDRPTSETTARAFLRELGLSVDGHRTASRFDYDDEAKVFLERTLGVEGFQRTVEGPVRFWRWSHRWFRPLEREEFEVEVATTGEVVGFRHAIAEDDSSASLSPGEARSLAESFLRARIRADLGGLELLEERREERKARTDHSFVWKQRDLDWAGGTARREVLVQGDAIGGYREWVQAPETWSRDYAALRSRNDAAAAVAVVLLVATFGATVFVALRRMRAGDVRWRVAGLFAGVGAVLTVLSALNGLPNALYGYETTQSFDGFLALQLVTAVAGGLFVGLFILFPAAAGESLYRRAFPEKLTLDGFFSLRGMRTRRFLLSAVTGLVLTCFFFAYQEVFYAIALHFGAWAPLDVPYSDLLNTAFPWIFVLLIGFLPAVSEEFLSRMFSIPFLRSATRSTAAAVVISAFIWGFAHSNYPNQPFFIRGLEVGIAGILIGVVMLRMNIGAALIWHFTVDALYTSVLLFRSGNTYYIVSAALASGLILLPLGYALVSYFRRGGFEDPSGLRNSDRGSRDPEPVAAEPPAVPARVAPWPLRSRAIALALSAAALVAVSFLPVARLGDAQRYQLSREEGEARARDVATLFGVPTDSVRLSTTSRSPYSDAFARYVLEHGGSERLRDEVTRLDSAFRWRTRFFAPLSPREATIETDVETGAVLLFQRTLAEADARPSVTAAEAESLARIFAARLGHDLVGMEKIEAAAENRPNRVDHTLLWQAPDGDARNPGEAHFRVRIVLHGNELGELTRSVELPEAWEREFERQDLASALRIVVAIGVGGALLGYLLWRLVLAHREGSVPWRRAFAWASVPGVVGALAAANGWPDVLARYPTTIPWNLFLVTAGLGLVIGALLPYLLVACSLAILGAAFPSIWSLSQRDVRAELARPALLAALVVLIVAVSFDRLGGWVVRAFPSFAPIPDLDPPAAASTLVPGFSLFHSAFRTSLGLVVAIAGALAVAIQPGLTRARRWGWMALLVLALTPIDARSTGELFLGLALAAIAIAAVALVVRTVLRDNPLSYALAAWGLVGTSLGWPYLRAQGNWFQQQGGLASILLLLALLWAVGPALSRRPGERIGDRSD